MSITFYLFTAHLFYYHILRVRDSVGELTREQRRCLRHYESIGPPEAWPVPTPMHAILESYGTVTPPSKYHGKIIPALPSFTGFTASGGIAGLSTVTGFMRTPPVPAIQKFVHNFGSTVADFTNGILYPIQDPVLSSGATGNQFLGLTNSSATGLAQHLFLCNGWNLPTEDEEGIMQFPYSQKRYLTARMNVPDVPDDKTITGLESFLGFDGDHSKAWMRRILRLASSVCRFFPDSSNLSQVGTTTFEEVVSPVHWSARANRTAKTNAWYRGRNMWQYTIKGKVNAETSGSMYKYAAAAAPHSTFANSIIPATFNTVASSANATGPYFVNPTGEQSVPLNLVEIVDQPDPARNMRAFIDANLYDNLGGRGK
uniref:Coat protein n=1 Tax=Ceratobasidium partitivirus CP-e TaxID=1970090 RepID=A0A219WGK1_9VIRU|nr:coat protein [Ceratobasidium partitivirus CP-e]